MFNIDDFWLLVYIKSGGFEEVSYGLHNEFPGSSNATCSQEQRVDQR